MQSSRTARISRIAHIIAVSLIALIARHDMAFAASKPVVVELFTSQGCSSCPPADAVLARLADRPDVIALAFHVDYWDYLGWKDPFATPANTARQRDYRASLHTTQVYTPQMVIGGAMEIPGQYVAIVDAAIANAAAHMPRGPDLALSRLADGTVTVNISAAPEIHRAAVVIAAYVPRVSTDIRRGENAGQVQVNANVVRRFMMLPPYEGKPFSETVAPGFAANADGIAIWIQSGEQGDILAAARLAPDVTH